MLIPVFSFSQEDEEECGLPDNKTIKKLYEKSMNRKKYKSVDKRYGFLKEALEEAEESGDDCVPCLWELARRSFARAKYKRTSYDIAERYYTQIENICPDYHSDVYYYLGLIHYQDDNPKQAEKYFKEFIKYRNEDDEKFADNYEQKLSAAKSILPELNFKNTFFKDKKPFNPKIVKNVSTKGQEYLPMISADDERIFFTRVYKHKGLGDIVSKRIEELVISSRSSSDEDFDAGKALPKPFNVGQNYGGVSISINNKELYVCACEVINGYNNCDIYMSNYEYVEDEKTGQYVYKWSGLKNLGSAINGNTTWEAQPSISADGQTLYFATSRPRSKGQDIYYSTRKKDGTWNRAKSMGNVINSKLNDKAPFLHTDSKTLYFASQVGGKRRGAGDFDIFYSRQGKDGKWSKPTNLGYPINSEGPEEGLVVSLQGDRAYFSSASGKGSVGGKDIYSFELPKEARPEKVVLLKGKLKDAEGNMLSDATLKLNYKDKSRNKELKIKTDDGNFTVAVNMKDAEKVLITLSKKGAVFKSRLVTKDDVKKAVLRGKDIVIEEVIKGNPFTINDINFATNSSELNENSKFILENFTNYLEENSDINFTIIGHTDDVGNDNQNLTLSQNRAEEVKKYLIEKGVSSSRINAKGMGESKPKVPNTSEKNRAVNRRTEFMIL